MIAVGEGTATITANVNGQKITKEITVVKDNARKIAQELTSLTVENGRVDFPTLTATASVYSVLIWKKLLPKTEVLTYRLKIKKWHLL